MAGQSVVISVLADTKKFSSGLGDASSGLDKFGKGLAGVGIAVGALAVAGGVVIGKLAADAFKAVAEVERLTAQTTAAVASTGGAAGRSVEQITGMADALERMTGVEAEVVQAGQNMLLTFTAIKGDQFDAATKAALDLSVAMGTDMTSASVLVGKALNDPLKGIGALSKVGVQLTEDQKALVKSMVEVGDTAGAQGVILGVLNEQFGGSAEAFGNTFVGSVAKVKNSFGAITEALIVGLLPAATSIMTGLNDLFVRVADSPAFAQIVANINSFITGLLSGEGPMSSFASTALMLWQNFSPLGIALQVLQPLIGPLVDAFMQLATTLGGALMQVLPTVQVVIGSLVQMMTALVPAIMPVITAVLGLVQPILTLIAPLMQLVQAVMPPLIAVITFLATTILGVLTPVINALIPIIEAVVQVLQGVIDFVIGVFTGNWEQAWDGIKGIFEGIWNLIVGIITGVWDIIVALITNAVNQVLSIVQAWGPSVLRFITEAWNNVMAFFNSIPGLVRSAFVAAGQWLLEAGSNIMRGLRSGIETAWSNVTGFLGSIPGMVSGALAGAGSWLLGAGRNIIDGLVSGLRNAGDAVRNMLLNIAKGAINAFKSFFGIASPSKLFRSYGKFMVQGLASGLKGSGNLIDSAMGDLSRRVDGGLNATLNVPVGYSGWRFGGASSGGGVTITVNVNNALATEAEIGRAVVSAISEYERAGGSVSFA